MFIKRKPCENKHRKRKPCSIVAETKTPLFTRQFRASITVSYHLLDYVSKQCTVLIKIIDNLPRPASSESDYIHCRIFGVYFKVHGLHRDKNIMDYKTQRQVSYFGPIYIRSTCIEVPDPAPRKEHERRSNLEAGKSRCFVYQFYCSPCYEF